MNRWLAFSISLVAHMSCVWLLLLSGKPDENKPMIVQTCRVTLFAPGNVRPSAPPSKRVVKSPTPPPRVNKVRPKPKPVFVRRTVTRQKPPPPPERFSDLPRLSKLEKEKPLTSPRETIARRVEAMNLSVSGGMASSYDAYIAGVLKGNWVRPSRAAVGENPPPVSVAIRIDIHGKIVRNKITRRSGISLLDASAVKAIERSNPLPIGLPSHMGCRYYDVTIVFRISDEV